MGSEGAAASSPAAEIMTRRPSPPGTSSWKTSSKCCATSLKVRSSAAAFCASRCLMSSRMESAPVSTASLRSRSCSRCSAKLAYWERAFLLTWEYFFSCLLILSTWSSSARLDMAGSTTAATSRGREPRARMAAECSSSLAESTLRRVRSLSSCFASSAWAAAAFPAWVRSSSSSAERRPSSSSRASSCASCCAVLASHSSAVRLARSSASRCSAPPLPASAAAVRRSTSASRVEAARERSSWSLDSRRTLRACTSARRAWAASRSEAASCCSRWRVTTRRCSSEVRPPLARSVAASRSLAWSWASSASSASSTSERARRF
mmetsp:Transcript_23508/g.73197  ORF Transcript_23508/g.73197 Transcript_23508/m.73197 type:complete len:321 (+) Transcript_23508:916-1878(+)